MNLYWLTTFEEECPPRKKFRVQKRVHSLKDPRLRKIRYGFRSLLLFLYKEKCKAYLIKRSKILEDKSLSNDQRDVRLWEIRKKREELASVHRTSPVSCGWCSNTTDDLVFSPNHQNWFCVTCYKDAHRLYPDDYP